jgi:hypothetical protein
MALRAIFLAWAGGALAVLVDVVVSSVFLAKHRIAFYVPIVGCGVQLVLGLVVFQMASWAGPIN